MKRLALSMVAAAAAALSSSAAFAEPVPSVTLGGYYDWTGPYIGGNGGAAWSGDRTVTAQKWFMEMPISDLAFGSRHVSGGFGGGQVGYNYQVSNFVFGVEANARGGSIHGGSSDETMASFFGRTGSIRLSTSECIGFFSTVVGRVGYSVNGLLFYATAGGAFGQTNTRIKMISSFGADAAARDEAWRGGTAFGGGFQYALSRNWSANFDYQHIDLGSSSIRATEFFGGVPWNASISTTTRHDFNIVSIGVNYKFDGGGTAVYLTPR